MNKVLIDMLIKQAKEAQEAGDYRKENNACKKLYNLYKRKWGRKNKYTIDILENLAISYDNLGVYNKSLELLKEVYVIRKEVLGENHLDTISTLCNLAVSYSNLGYYSKALEVNKKVYILRKKILGENHPDTLSSLGNLANSYSDLGDYSKALEMKNAVYTALKEILGENHPDTLSSLSNLANSYSDLGDYSKAHKLQNIVYNSRKNNLGKNHPDTLSALENLAVSYSDLGDYSKALELQNTVYNAFKGLLGKNHPDTLDSLNNLALTYSNLGDYKKALEMRNTVYNTRKEILGENHPGTLKSLNNLANSYSDLGDYSKERELQNIVYNSRKKNLGENHPDTLSDLNNLAASYSDLGDYSMACELQNIVYNAFKEILGENHPGTLLVLSNLLVFQILQDETDNQSIKKHMTAYFENINNLKTTASNITEVSSRRNFLTTFNDIYELLKSCIFERNIKDLLDYLFINKNLSFEIDVNRFHNEIMGKRLSLEEVTHLIKSKLIIDFYELDDSKYGLILIKKGNYSQFVADFEDIINGSFVDNKDIQPFIGQLEDYDHIYVCPDGELYNISFERVLNCSNISYLSSVQTLFKKNTDDDNTNQLVSFVYPDFSGTQSEDNDRGDKKGVLYGSYLEGMFIHDIYGENSIVYSSYQANHENFINTKRPRILHVSTHGDYLDNEHIEPMDRGILCLSGYNVEDNNSGYISAREIQYMDLKGTKLAVLSACNTGLGENISGEGIYGIRRAFELAGCQTLLLTVEEVDDFNSAIFMKSFYERYNQTNNIYQSFKDTKEYLKEHGLKELKELRDVFEKEMKNKINSHMVYTRNLKELNRRIEESETRRQIVRRKNGEYVVEDWNGFIIQGKIVK